MRPRIRRANAQRVGVAPDQSVLEAIAQLRRTTASVAVDVRLIPTDVPCRGRSHRASGNPPAAATITPRAAAISSVASVERTVWLSGVTAFAAIAVIARVAASHLADDRAVAQASTIVVAPFRVNSSNPMTADLREGLVDLLSVRIADADTRRSG